MDDFESGLDNWITLGSTNETYSLSATHSFMVSQEVPFLPDSESIAVTALPIDLSASTNPVVTFWYRVTGSEDSSDRLRLEVSTLGGANWSQVWSDTCYTVSTWTFQQVDLSSYKSDKIKIRFRMTSDSDEDVADGWYIDDIEIKEM